MIILSTRQLDHPNLCKFFGGCIEVPYVSIITEHCPKGSLSDVLLNDDIPINWGFRQENNNILLTSTACHLPIVLRSL